MPVREIDGETELGIVIDPTSRAISSLAVEQPVAGIADQELVRRSSDEIDRSVVGDVDRLPAIVAQQIALLSAGADAG